LLRIVFAILEFYRPVELHEFFQRREAARLYKAKVLGEMHDDRVIVAVFSFLTISMECMSELVETCKCFDGYFINTCRLFLNYSSIN